MDQRTKTSRHTASVKSERVVTLDLGFADIRKFPPADHSGLIVLRVADQARGHILGVMAMVLRLLEREPLEGRLWIVTDAAVRIRR